MKGASFFGIIFFKNRLRNSERTKIPKNKSFDENKYYFIVKKYKWIDIYRIYGTSAQNGYLVQKNEK